METYRQDIAFRILNYFKVDTLQWKHADYIARQHQKGGKKIMNRADSLGKAPL